MVEPISITATALATLGAVQKLFDHPIIAYFIVLFVLMADAGLSSTLGFNGIIGSVVSGLLGFVFNNFGINFFVSSNQLLIIFAFLFPIGYFCMKRIIYTN
jgi:hypothetical protein